jgi:rubrerythrin
MSRDSSVSEKRREDYALTRDQQALNYNEAIARRLNSGNTVKCRDCGKEFPAGKLNDLLCPACSEKK